MNFSRAVFLGLVSLFFAVAGASALVIPNGTLDSSFNPSAFTNGDVNAIVEQPDGKILLGGRFAKANGAPHLNIARLLADGSIDSSFNPATDPNGQIVSVILQSDGKIILLGSFFEMNGVDRFGVARLNSSGTLDSAFNPGNVVSLDGADDGAGNATSPGTISTVLLQPSGRIVVFGTFSSVITGAGTSVARNGVAAFTSAGAFDSSFNPGAGFNFTADPSTTSPNYVVQQTATGRIVVAGHFDSFDGHMVPGLVGLTSSGAYDAAFNPGTAAPIDSLGGLFVQSNDQVLVFGDFTSFNGSARNQLARMNVNGALDSGFIPSVFKDYADVRWASAIGQQTNGKLVVTGAFHTSGGNAANGIVRLNTDGSFDSTFASSNAVGPNGYGESLFVRADDRVFVGGYFSSYDGVNRSNFSLVQANGALESAFAASGVTDGTPQVIATGTQSDGRIVVGGTFSSYGGVPHYNLVRLFADGSLDSSFAVGAGASRSVRSLIILPNDQILIAGQFGAINGVQKMRVALLNADGSIDPSFDAGDGPNDIVYAMTRDSAGNVFLGGAFTAANGIARPRLVKLNPGGAVDLSFAPTGGPDGDVRVLAPPSGSAGLLVGGFFANYNGSATGSLLRLDASTGVLDGAFQSSMGVGFNGTVRTLNLLKSGQYLVGGTFTRFNGVNHPRLVRLNSNGSLDGTFSPALNGSVYAALPFGSGVYLSGLFSLPTPTVARLSAAGAAISSFSSGTGAAISPAEALAFAPASVVMISRQPDGKLLVGGVLNQFNGVAQNSLARLTGPELKVTSVSKSAAHIILQGVGEVSTTYNVEGAASLLGAYAAIGSVTTDATGAFQFDDATHGAATAYFYRLAIP